MEVLYKIKDRIREYIYIYNIGKPWYLKLYSSYWHREKIRSNTKNKNYLAARPHPDAGIGHQMANWIAGYWFAQYFDLQFAHIPFSSSRSGTKPSKWEDYLGFGVNEKKLSELKKNEGYKIVRLPFFDEGSKDEVASIKSIIESYKFEKVVFLCEQNQYFKDQYLLSQFLQEKFYAASSNRKGISLFDSNMINIAVHVRRGDIVQSGIEEGQRNENLSMRWLDDNYYLNVIEQTLDLIKSEKPVQILLFSQGKEEDFSEYKRFPNLKFCLDVSAMDTFEHLCNADILITSKSSFSYKPALLNRGIKICPMYFWHGYPDANDWLLADNKGIIQSPHLISFE